MEPFHRVHDGGRVIHQCVPGDQAGQNDNDRNVENSANYQGGNDPYGQIAPRIFAFFCGSRDRIKTDVSEENDGAACQDSGPSVGGEWMPIAGMNEVQSESNENQNGKNL